VTAEVDARVVVLRNGRSAVRVQRISAWVTRVDVSGLPWGRRVEWRPRSVRRVAWRHWVGWSARVVGTGFPLPPGGSYHGASPQGGKGPGHGPCYCPTFVAALPRGLVTKGSRTESTQVKRTLLSASKSGVVAVGQAEVLDSPASKLNVNLSFRGSSGQRVLTGQVGQAGHADGPLLPEDGWRCGTGCRGR
jgi:hypothetical protein